MSIHAHKKQPKALFVLFLTEMWERFSFYGMRSLLVLYIVTQLNWGDKAAYATLGAYATLVYLGNILGGWFADQLLGFRRAILIGGITITCGHFMLTFEHAIAFYLGLGLVLTGTGLFKANITTFLSDFYEEHDPRREAGYTLFYLGINVGGFLAFLTCGYTAQRFGWHYAFGLAGIGMLLGLTIFILGQKYLEGKGEPQYPERLKIKVAGIPILTLFCLSMPVVAGLAALIIKNNQILGSLFIPIVGTIVLVYTLYVAFKHTLEERLRILALMVLTAFVVIFIAFWEQQASSVTLFTEYHVDRALPLIVSNLIGIDVVPASSLPIFNSIAIIVFAGLIALIWERLGERDKAPFAPMKFVIAFLLLGGSFYLLGLPSTLAETGSTINMGWVIAFYIIYSVGEICIMPVGFAIVPKLAPKDYRGYFMGVFFLGIAFAEYAAGVIATLTSVDEMGMERPSISVFGEFFEKAGFVVLCTAAAMLLFSFVMKPIFRKIEG